MGQRSLDVRWRPLSLRLLNDGRYDDPDMAAKKPGHTIGLHLLRVAAAVDEAHGNEAVGRLYTAMGQAGTIEESTRLALERVGGESGTPIITFGAPDGPTFFGPVISQVPRGPAAVELWEAVETIALHPSFTELKRSLREPPQVAS